MFFGVPSPFLRFPDLPGASLGPKIPKLGHFRWKLGPPVISETKQVGKKRLLTSCLLMIVGQLLFSQVEFFSLKIFQGGPLPPKHAKFKSKKQNFLDFKILLHEAYLWTS